MGHYVTMQVYVTDVYARGVKRGALATEARGYSLWRYLLKRLTRAWEFRVRDSLGARTSLYCADPGGYVHHTRMLGVNLPLIFSQTIQ